MAHVRLNPAIESIRGRVGDFVYKTFEGQDIVTRVPDFSNRVLTDAQKAAIEKFCRAAGYGKIVMADEQAKTLYEQVAKSRHQPLFSLIMQDFLNAPQVEEVDLSGYTGQAGEKIYVVASDDFEVMAVHVTISEESGDPIETGAAVKSTDGSGRWVYTTTAPAPPGTPITIGVSATDRPGHTGTKTQTR